MIVAFLTPGQWLLIAGGIVLVILLLVPATRPYVRAIVSSIRALLLCIVLLFLLALGALLVYLDLEYAFTGQEAEATVTRTEPARNGVHVEYRFVDADGNPRTGNDTAAQGWTAPPDGTVTVQYLPGADGHSRLSRMRSQSTWIPYVMFFGSGLALLLLIAFTVRRVMKTVQPASER